MTFKTEKGSAINVSAKQKLNTESFTVAEPVGIDCVLPLMPWASLFLKEQGYEVKENIVKQDNKSAILLANDGKASLDKQTQAINVQCFHITDQIKKGNMAIQHCHTDEMTSDFMSKGPQGVKFRKF